MSRKRRNTSSAEPESPSQKRSSTLQYDEADESDYSDVSEQPQVDTATGQQNAFPGLAASRDLFYGPAADGIDYLRMVRSEREGIPHLLTNTNLIQSQQEPADIRQDGFFDEDEAFIAAPVASNNQDNRLSKTQQAYYDAVLVHFNLMRATLRCTPPLHDVQALPPSVPISFPTSSRAAKEKWERYILESIPHPVQLACMDIDSVLELIRLITRKMTWFIRSKTEHDTNRISSWIWSTLARCPDRGQLGSEEISDLRALAKRADATWTWLSDRASAEADATNDIIGGSEEHTEDEAEKPSETLGGSVSGKDAKGIDPQGMMQIPSMAGRSEPKQALKLQLQGQQMLLDVIITIVGEVYGQRDLLEMRRAWVGVDTE